jgi:hypothetical protein
VALASGGELASAEPLRDQSGARVVTVGEEAADWAVPAHCRLVRNGVDRGVGWEFGPASPGVASSSLMEHEIRSIC